MKPERGISQFIREHYIIDGSPHSTNWALENLQHTDSRQEDHQSPLNNSSTARLRFEALAHPTSSNAQKRRAYRKQDKWSLTSRQAEAHLGVG